MKKVLGVLVMVGLLAGCSSITVNTDYSVDADFTQFKTFEYRDSDNTVESSNPLAHQRIVAALRQGMASSGLTETDKDPDVYVTYYGSTSEQLQFNTTYMGVSGWGHMGRHMGTSMTTATTRTTTVTQGTLVMDVWDAGKNGLVWRGVSEGSLSSNPDRNTDRINSAVERAFRDFPPN